MGLYEKVKLLADLLIIVFIQPSIINVPAEQDFAFFNVSVHNFSSSVPQFDQAKRWISTLKVYHRRLKYYADNPTQQISLFGFRRN